MKLAKIIIVMLLLISFTQSLCQIDINNLKAAYTEKFTRFIEWPESGDKSMFVIGYYQEDEYIQTLKDYLEESNIREKQVVFLKIDSPKMIGECDMVCIDKPDREKKEDLLAEIKDKPILVITQYENSALEGFHINFYILDDRLKFEMNPATLKKSGLKASYHLLKLARLVSEEE